MLSKTRFQALAAFTRKKERIASGFFFVDGWRWLEEALALPEAPECVLALAGAARNEAETALLARARAVAREFHEASEAQLARLTGSVSASGVAALLRWRAVDFAVLTMAETGDPALIVGLDGVSDPGNAGTIVRTADWFGASGVVLGPGSVEPTNPKLARSTMGSLFHLPVVETAELKATLGAVRERGFVAVGAALDGVPLPEFSWPRRVMLVIGGETNGIGPEVGAMLGQRVRIPGNGRAESLNAAVAAAVLMADWRRVIGTRPE